MSLEGRAGAPERISGHSPYEKVAGFSRAIVCGYSVFVAGTAPVPADGGPPPEGAGAQARLCLTLIGEALERAGSSLDEVVRTRMYLVDAADWDEVALVHGTMLARARPVATAVVVKALLDPRWRVEIEADAIRR